MTAFTDAELAALRAAYAKGVLRVEYEGRSVVYGGAADLLARIREIERSMDTASGTRRTASFASFSRG